MYVRWFIEWAFEFIASPFAFAFKFAQLVFELIESLANVFLAFPFWLSYPFYALLSIAVLFRVSQFIPTIGGASN